PRGPERLARNPVGAAAWTSEAELFEVLNRSVAYVVTGGAGADGPDGLLRDPHVSLLTDDYLTLHAVLGARPRLARPHGGPFKIRIGDEWVGVRLRFVGDGFYDAAWAQHLMASRRKDAAGRSRPPDDEDFAALVYDRCAHATGRPASDVARLSDLASDLGISEWPPEARTSPGAVDTWMEGWLKARGYASVEPKDTSVPYDASFAAPPEGTVTRSRSALGRRLSWWSYRVRQAVGHLYWTARDRLLLRMPWLRPSGWHGRRGLASEAKRLARSPELFFPRRIAMLGRGLLFVGRAFRCPCCGWSLRGFVGEWGILASNHDGYCPRCNAKARHRRLWIYLQEHMSLSERDLRILEVAPWWAISRRLMQAPNIRFVGMDIARQGPHVTVVGDVTRAPLASDSVDAALCTHTLEHIEDDRMALRELHRVLKPGGWAIVSVPLDLDAPTYEDSSVTDPDDREREFGERGHVRLYGLDIEDRLNEAGFSVELDRAEKIPDATRTRFGLRDDENLFVCRKV
ncbi:MAG: class I SAM-dependent methyltransferase, partial [Gemmatimonadota bacterium]|nr:class I SAM-dependent methyltransferase [Gemmatimonadota bacterium]